MQVRPSGRVSGMPVTDPPVPSGFGRATSPAPDESPWSAVELSSCRTHAVGSVPATERRRARQAASRESCHWSRCTTTRPLSMVVAPIRRSRGAHQAVVELVHRLVARVIGQPAIDQLAASAVHRTTERRHVDRFQRRVGRGAGRACARRSAGRWRREVSRACRLSCPSAPKPTSKSSRRRWPPCGMRNRGCSTLNVTRPPSLS